MKLDLNRFTSDIKTVDFVHAAQFFYFWTKTSDNIETNSDLCKFYFPHEN